MKNKIFILGVGFNNLTKKEVLEYILESSAGKYYIVTPNPEILVIADSDKNYKKTLNNARLALPDGIGVLLAAKFLGFSFKEKITGIGLLESLCQAAAKQPITVGFLGGAEAVAVKAAECLKKSYPSLKVSFAAPNLKFKVQNSKFPKTDILFVAFGSPKQELWIAKNLSKLPVRVAIGVGGAFDFISGRVPRAPKWMQDLGFEWLFRLIIQPWRIKRQLSLLKFTYLVFEEKFS